MELPKGFTRNPGERRVPEGWRWVPKLATGKMLAEARKRGRGLEECWQIMVDLAPDAPAPEGTNCGPASHADKNEENNACD